METRKTEHMQFDRRASLATLGTAAAINAMPSEALADALERHMMKNLDAGHGLNGLSQSLDHVQVVKHLLIAVRECVAIRRSGNAIP
jgi:hypothetical protein